LGFVSYRLAFFAHSSERGPFAILERVRAWFGRKAATAHQTGLWYEIALLVTCPLCIGVWVSLILALLVFDVSFMAVLAWFCVAGIQHFLTRVVIERV